ncbi:MAG: hypothetical protein AB3N16_05550 [Flavobacteriaceae bacterium]
MQQIFKRKRDFCPAFLLVAVKLPLVYTKPYFTCISSGTPSNTGIFTSLIAKLNQNTMINNVNKGRRMMTLNVDHVVYEICDFDHTTQELTLRELSPNVWLCS